MHFVVFVMLETLAFDLDGGVGNIELLVQQLQINWHGLQNCHLSASASLALGAPKSPMGALGRLYQVCFSR